ncbi:hypothetical protein M0R45_020510 [Rubus argutus]|uniref:Jacalin-type lectin domain-containing protein n=1 Tax=Rubus argutus TaxID=59490 RepID=A0AAW1XAD2_RUBAR
MDCENYDEKKPLTVGPFGESEGEDSFDDGVHSTVKRLVITHEVFIQSIQIEYDDNGSPIWSDRHGELSRSITTDKVTINLDYPDEFLTSIYGNRVTPSLTGFISSLTFKSNKKSYGPYGCESGKHFSIEVPGYKIVGFHGRTNRVSELIAIGGHLKPIDHYRNDKCHPSKPLGYIGSSVVPTVRYPSKLLLPPEYPCHTKVISEYDDKANKQISCIISGNQVGGNEGNRNGTFAVANKYKYITQYYYVGNSNAM